MIIKKINYVFLLLKYYSLCINNAIIMNIQKCLYKIDKLQLSDKNNDIYSLNLSELKTILKSNKKLSDESKTIIKTKVIYFH